MARSIGLLEVERLGLRARMGAPGLGAAAAVAVGDGAGVDCSDGAGDALPVVVPLVRPPWLLAGSWPTGISRVSGGEFDEGPAAAGWPG